MKKLQLRGKRRRDITEDDRKKLLAEYAREDREYRKQWESLPFRIKLSKFGKDVIQKANSNLLIFVAFFAIGQALRLKHIPRK